jgi:hypothetical protein
VPDAGGRTSDSRSPLPGLVPPPHNRTTAVPNQVAEPPASGSDESAEVPESPPETADAEPPRHGPGGHPSPGPFVPGRLAEPADDEQSEESRRPPTVALQRKTRTPQQQRPAMIMSADTFIATWPPITLFGPKIASRKWDILEPTFIPLAGGTFIVDGIPISFKLEGSASAQSFAGMVFGPATLGDIRIYVTGAEADRQRRIREFPVELLAPPFLPGGGVVPVVRRGLDRPWDREPEGKFSADAMLRFTAAAAAGTTANAKLSAELGLFGNTLEAGAFAGLKGSANASARTSVDTYVTMSYDDGSITMGMVLDLGAAIELAFKLSAYAGVWVELGFPEIPVVTDLTHEVQDWPIVGWVVPDLEAWRWRKEYRKEWPVFEKTYSWDMSQHFEVGTAGSTGTLSDPSGFAIDQVLRDAEASQREGELKDDPVGPGEERRNSDPGAVSAVKSEALAQISSAQRAAEREHKANTRLLAEAKKKAAAGPSSAAAGGGADPVEQLEAREDKLEQAEKSTEQLRDRADALAEPATAPDGVARNQARSGYEAIATNADALGDKINRGEDGFEVPAVVEPSDADYERMREAMHKAYDAFDEAFDPTRTEKLYADDQVRAAGRDADLGAYRHAAHEYQREALALWRRVQQLEKDLERAREWYERGDHALGAKVFGELEAKARTITTDAAALKGTRPVGDWDVDYVELSEGHLMLKPEYRGKATRSYFYPHDYSSGTKDRMMREIGSVRAVDGIVYWEYRGRRSPRGDHWWLLLDPQEMPTLDHTTPTVLGHWNSSGRTTSYADRRRYYDFEGAKLVVVPKQFNSSAGGKEPDSYTPRVTRTFRGSKV